MQSSFSGKRLYGALLSGVLAGALVFGITSGAGPGLDPDAMAYVGAATSIAHQGTIRVPTAQWSDPDSTAALTIWPPGFPLAIAVPELIGVSPLQSGRIVLVLSALVTFSLLFWVLAREPLGISGSAIAVAAIFVTPAIARVHLSILSEPLFLACLMLTLCAIFSRTRRPILAGAAAGACVMVRYAGVSAVAAVVLWYLLQRDRPVRQRLGDSLRAALIPAAFLLIWFARIHHLAVGRSVVKPRVYGNWLPTLRVGISTLADWLAPGLSGYPRDAAAILVCAALAVLSWKAYQRIRSATRTGRHEAEVEFLRAALLLLACYVITLLLSRLTVGGLIPFDFRLLAPAMLLASAGLATALGFVLTTRRAWRATFAAILVWMGGATYASAPLVADNVTDGLDFAGSDWRLSDTIDWVKSDGTARTLFSNWPPAIYFHAGRPAHDIPRTLACRDLQNFWTRMRESDGALVAFAIQSPDYPPPDSLARRLGLREEARLSDGKIWSLPPRASSAPSC